ARGRGQSSSGVVVDFFAPPPVDRGIIPSLQRSPDSPETALRAAIRTSSVALDRKGASGAHYIAGKVIVNCKDGGCANSRASVMSAARARSSAQPSYANFDIMTIDPNDDAEQTAQALAARSDVEYAQAAYRAHADCASGWPAPDSNGRCIPNDPGYPQQWNLSDIDIERAWNVQPAAGNSVTVAVLDTGIAYTNVTMRYHASAFKIDSNGDVEPPNF